MSSAGTVGYYVTESDGCESIVMCRFFAFIGMSDVVFE